MVVFLESTWGSICSRFLSITCLCVFDTIKSVLRAPRDTRGSVWKWIKELTGKMGFRTPVDLCHCPLWFLKGWPQLEVIRQTMWDEEKTDMRKLHSIRQGRIFEPPLDKCWIYYSWQKAFFPATRRRKLKCSCQKPKCGMQDLSFRLDFFCSPRLIHLALPAIENSWKTLCTRRMDGAVN